jgi:hypothetical protein
MATRFDDVIDYLKSNVLTFAQKAELISAIQLPSDKYKEWAEEVSWLVAELDLAIDIDEDKVNGFGVTDQIALDKYHYNDYELTISVNETTGGYGDGLVSNIDYSKLSDLRATAEKLVCAAYNKYPTLSNANAEISSKAYLGLGYNVTYKFNALKQIQVITTVRSYSEKEGEWIQTKTVRDFQKETDKYDCIIFRVKMPAYV